MRKYLLSNLQKATIAIIGLSYIGYIIFATESYKLDPEKIFSPYPKIIFIIAIIITLSLIKKVDWRPKIKFLTLVATLIFVFYVTSYELRHFKEGARIIFEDPELSQSEQMGHYLDFIIYNSFGKAILFNLLAIFAFFAINQTINGLKDPKE